MNKRKFLYLTEKTIYGEEVDWKGKFTGATEQHILNTFLPEGITHSPYHWVENYIVQNVQQLNDKETRQALQTQQFDGAKIFIDSHQADVKIPKWVDGVFLRSFYHQRRLRSANPGLPIEKCFITGNTLSVPRGASNSRSKTIVYGSSPDRGLYNLLMVWDDVLKEEPDAKLLIANNYSLWDSIKYYSNFDGVRAVDGMSIVSRNSDSIRIIRPDSHDEFIDILAEAAALVYPFDGPEGSELFCNTIGEAIVLDTPVICSAMEPLDELWQNYVAAMIEEVPDGVTRESAQPWIDAILTALRGHSDFHNDRIAAPLVKETYSSYNVRERYLNALEGREPTFGLPDIPNMDDLNGDNLRDSASEVSN